MNQKELEQAAITLKKISKNSWEEFFASEQGNQIYEKIQLARSSLGKIKPTKGVSKKFVNEILGIFGDSLLTNNTVGPWVRAMLIRSLTMNRWKKLQSVYMKLRGKSSTPVHGNATQSGTGADIVATYWHQGSVWASEFCEICRLPQSLASRHLNVLPSDEAVETAYPLPSLHKFQVDVYKKMRKLLNGPMGKNAILSLPTGAGKTRVTVEALLDHLAEQNGSAKRNAILWIAQSEELLRQAWECIRQIWLTVPEQNGKKPVPRHGFLTIRRAWGGGLVLSEMELDDGPIVLLAGIQQLDRWINKLKEVPPWPTQRFIAVVIDEAHRLVTPAQRKILVELGLCKQHYWKPLKTAPPVIGLTATPWRTQKKSDKELIRFFKSKLIIPKQLGKKPIKTLQNQKYLAKVKYIPLLCDDTPMMTAGQKKRYEQFGDLPNDYLVTIGRHPKRNEIILSRLLKISKKASVLVFACSIEHAEILTIALSQAGRVSRCVTGKTPRYERLTILEAFRTKGVNFVCNVGVLTTGFDAPKVDVVCITRPTRSALLYEQMVGRGLRGPKNGGTEICRILDVQDKGLPKEIMSYERVLDLWEPQLER